MRHKYVTALLVGAVLELALEVRDLRRLGRMYDELEDCHVRLGARVRDSQRHLAWVEAKSG